MISFLCGAALALAVKLWRRVNQQQIDRLRRRAESRRPRRPPRIQWLIFCWHSSTFEEFSTLAYGSEERIRREATRILAELGPGWQADYIRTDQALGGAQHQA